MEKMQEMFTKDLEELNNMNNNKTKQSKQTKTGESSKCWEDRGLCYKTQLGRWETDQWFLQNLNMESPHNPAIPLGYALKNPQKGLAWVFGRLCS